MTNSQMTDFESFLNDDGLVTPKIKSTKYPDGKVYTVPSPDAETGLRLAGLAQLAAQASAGIQVGADKVQGLVLGDDEERTFMQQVMGSAYQEMIDDGVSWVSIQRLSQYAFAYFSLSPQAANRGVETGAFSGKAPAPANRAEKRAKVKGSTGAKSQKRPALADSKSPKAKVKV